MHASAATTVSTPAASVSEARLAGRASLTPTNAAAAAANAHFEAPSVDFDASTPTTADARGVSFDAAASAAAVGAPDVNCNSTTTTPVAATAAPADFDASTPTAADARGVRFDAAAAAVGAPDVSCNSTTTSRVAATAAPAAAPAAASVVPHLPLATLTARKGYSIAAPRAQLAARPGDSIVVLAPLEAKHVLEALSARPKYSPVALTAHHGYFVVLPTLETPRVTLAWVAGLASLTPTEPLPLAPIAAHTVSTKAGGALSPGAPGLLAPIAACTARWRQPRRRSSPP